MTARPELPKIRAVRARPNYKLELQWEHDETSVIDMRKIIASGGVFDALGDYDFFVTVQLGDRGRYVEWRDPLNRDRVLADYDADSLILLADKQQNVSLTEKAMKTLRNRLVHNTNETS